MGRGRTSYTPDSVVARHLSQATLPLSKWTKALGGLAAPGLPGVTRPHRRRCDGSEPGLCRAHPTRLAPHQPAQSPSRSHRCDRWWALTPPFHPSPVPVLAGHRLVCSLLPSCVTDRLLRQRPTLRFQWVACPTTVAGARSREVPQESALCSPATGRSFVSSPVG